MTDTPQRDRIIEVLRQHDCFFNANLDVIGCICGARLVGEPGWERHVAGAVAGETP